MIFFQECVLQFEHIELLADAYEFFNVIGSDLFSRLQVQTDLIDLIDDGSQVISDAVHQHAAGLVVDGQFLLFQQSVNESGKFAVIDLILIEHHTLLADELIDLPALVIGAVLVGDDQDRSGYDVLEIRFQFLEVTQLVRFFDDDHLVF